MLATTRRTVSAPADGYFCLTLIDMFTICSSHGYAPVCAGVVPYSLAGFPGSGCDLKIESAARLAAASGCAFWRAPIVHVGLQKFCTNFVRTERPLRQRWLRGSRMRQMAQANGTPDPCLTWKAKNGGGLRLCGRFQRHGMWFGNCLILTCGANAGGPSLGLLRCRLPLVRFSG